MILKLQIFIILISLGLCGLFFEMLKKEIIQLKYSLLWLMTSVFLIFISLFPETVRYLSDLIGIMEPTNTVFLFSIFFLVLIVFSLSLALSKQSQRITRLSQEIALLKGIPPPPPGNQKTDHESE